MELSERLSRRSAIQTQSLSYGNRGGGTCLNMPPQPNKNKGAAGAPWADGMKEGEGGRGVLLESEACSDRADVRTESMWDEMKSLHSSPCHVKGCRFRSLASSLRSPLLPVIHLAAVSLTFPRCCSTFPERLGCKRDTHR